MPIVGRLDQYASILCQEFDEVTVTTNASISGLGTYFATEFSENVDITIVNNIFPAYNIIDGLFAEVTSGVGLSFTSETLICNNFSAYNVIDGEFALPLYGPGNGTYMRQDYIKDVIVYNEIDEITTIY